MLNRHTNWIEKHLLIQKEKQQHKIVLSPEQIMALKLKAKEIIPHKVEHFAKIMNLKPTSVKITSAQKRFGSCSGKNSLCFSYILMQYPEKAIDYVVVHELAHRIEMNHSQQFWTVVEHEMPDYRERRKRLKEYRL